VTCHPWHQAQLRRRAFEGVGDPVQFVVDAFAGAAFLLRPENAEVVLLGGGFPTSRSPVLRELVRSRRLIVVKAAFNGRD